MMASSSPLKDIEEKFFECSLCLSLFTEPKQLPSCLHRYCKACLQDYLKDFPESFRCPLCKHQYDTPEEGVDKFKTDFHTKSVVEFIRLQKSLKQEEVRACFGCQEMRKVTAHCFKCKGFLCRQCHQFHLTNGMVTEHRQHILDLESVDTKTLTLERISSLSVGPRCSVHAESSAQLLCHSCEDVPICVACIYGDHEGHTFTEVKKLARKEREDLTERLSELSQHEEKLREFPKKVEDARGILKAEVAKGITKVEKQHDHWLQRISTELDRSKERRARKRTSIQRRKSEEIDDLKVEMNMEIARLKKKYEDMIKKREGKFQHETKSEEKSFDRVDAMLLEKRAKLDSDCESFKEEITTKGLSNRGKLQEIAKFSSDSITRCEDFAATASTVLASRDHWTDALGIPGVRAAGEPLLKDVRRDLPPLDTISRVPCKDLPLVLVEGATPIEISDDMDDCDIAYDYEPIDIASCSGNEIVYTGKVRKWGRPAGNFIVTRYIHRDGPIFRRMEPGGIQPDFGPLCCALDFETAASSSTGVLRLYDTQTGRLTLTRMLHDITGGGADETICALVADREKREILLTSTSKPGEVFFVDSNLRYLRSLLLPRVIKGFSDGCLNRGNLVLCDSEGQQAYLVTMDDSVANVLRKLDKPALAVGFDWIPHRVCIDSSNRIYVLWFSHIAINQRECVVAQYTPDGSQLMGVKKVDCAAYALCTSKGRLHNEEELLVVAYTGQIEVFGLIA